MTAPRRAAIRERLEAYNAGPNEKYETIAAVFRERTGMLAPGKDDCLGTHPREERERAWSVFVSEYTVERLTQSMSDLAYLLAASERLEGENAALKADAARLDFVLDGMMAGASTWNRRVYGWDVQAMVTEEFRNAPKDADESIASIQARASARHYELARAALDKAMIANAERGACDHTWIDARNAVVTSGEYCAKCGAIRATQAETTTPHADGAR